MNPLHLATQGLLSQRPITIATDGLYFIVGGSAQFISVELATLSFNIAALTRIRNLKPTDTLYVYRHEGITYLYNASSELLQILKENRQLLQQLQNGVLPLQISGFSVKELPSIDLHRKNAYILKDNKFTTQLGTKNRKTV